MQTKISSEQARAIASCPRYAKALQKLAAAPAAKVDIEKYRPLISGLIGALGGAGLGAGVGYLTGNTGAGALAGAGVGGLTGYGHGDVMSGVGNKLQQLQQMQQVGADYGTAAGNSLLKGGLTVGAGAGGLKALQMLKKVIAKRPGAVGAAAKLLPLG